MTKQHTNIHLGFTAASVIYSLDLHTRNGNPDKNTGPLDAKYRRVLLSARLNLGYEFGTAMLVDSRCDPPVNNTGLGKTVS